VLTAENESTCFSMLDRKSFGMCHPGSAELTFAASKLRRVGSIPRGFHEGDSSFSLALRNSRRDPFLMQVSRTFQ